MPVKYDFTVNNIWLPPVELLYCVCGATPTAKQLVIDVEQWERRLSKDSVRTERLDVKFSRRRD